MDDFRRQQKALCINGAPNRPGKYGCACCRGGRRWGANLNEFKKVSRRLAKARLRQADRRATDGEAA